MKTNQNKDIIEAVKILSKKYNAIDKTTLNRMRTKPDPYKILISCLLSLRAKDETTEKISEKLYKIVETPQQMLEIPTEQLEKIIFSTGHYRKKAQTLKNVSNELIERFNSQVPNTREELMSIKGVGPKTANIVLAFAFNQPVIPVDTHVQKSIGLILMQYLYNLEEIFANQFPLGAVNALLENIVKELV